jgi:hypothetical protein
MKSINQHQNNIQQLLKPIWNIVPYTVITSPLNIGTYISLLYNL